MNQEVISTKLLLISVSISIFLLLVIYVAKNLDKKPLLAFCNNNNKINVLLQIENNDILINPIGTKEVLECLGKHIPYYDRQIELVISDKDDVINELRKRYTVNKIVKGKEIIIGNYSISIGTNILIKDNNNEIIICQRPITKITREMMSDGLSLLIRAKNEKPFSDLIKEEYLLDKVEVGVISL